MAVGQRGAQRCYGVPNAVLVAGDRIKVPFDNNEVSLLAAVVLCHVQSVQHVTLAVQRGFRGVQIFGQGVVHHPAAEGDHLAGHIADRENDPAAEPVVISFSLAPLDHQPGPFHLSWRIVALFQVLQQAVPFRPHVTERELLDDRVADAAFLRDTPAQRSRRGRPALS